MATYFDCQLCKNRDVKFPENLSSGKAGEEWENKLILSAIEMLILIQELRDPTL
jgi:hypothetical protein